MIEGKDLGGSIRHAGWTLEFDSGARLRWPVYPYNPYRNGPETRLDLAVAALSFPLELRADPKRYVRPRERTIRVKLTVD